MLVPKQRGFRLTTRRFIPILATFSLVGVFGCPGGGSLIDQILGNTSGPTIEAVTIRLVNLTGANNVQVSLLVDSRPVQISCLADIEICDFLQPACPDRIEVLEQRNLDASNAYLGGRQFNGNEAFIFVPPEYACGDTIVLRFTTEQAEAIIP